MYNSENWSKNISNKIGLRKKLLSFLSLHIRKNQYDLFLNEFQPTRNTSIIDLGITPDESLRDSNFFEYIYPYKNKLVVASVEDCSEISKKMKVKKFVKLNPNRKYPFENNEFDIAVSWATLEHVGSNANQQDFINEITRISKSFFITTPYRFFPYELHTGIFFLHWLQKSIFRKILKLLDQDFWSEEQNLNLLSLNEAKSLIVNPNIKVKLYHSFGFLPTHIIIYKIP